MTNFSQFDGFIKDKVLNMCACACLWLPFVTNFCLSFVWILRENILNSNQFKSNQFKSNQFKSNQFKSNHRYPAAVTADAGVVVRFSVGVKKHVVLLPGSRRH